MGFFAISVSFSNSLPNDEYANLLIVAAFSNSPISGKTSSLVKKLCLPKFPDDRGDIVLDFVV